MFSPSSTANTYTTADGVVAPTTNTTTSNQQHLLHQQQQHYMQQQSSHSNMYNQQLLNSGQSLHAYNMAPTNASLHSQHYMQPQHLNQYAMHHGHHHQHLTPTQPIDQLIHPIDLYSTNAAVSTSNLGHHHLKCNFLIFFFLIILMF